MIKLMTRFFASNSYHYDLQITHHCVIEDLNMLNIYHKHVRNISSTLFSNSEENASELLDNIEEMFPITDSRFETG